MGDLSPTFNISLRGSNAALGKMLDECSWTGTVDETASREAVLGPNAPYEAVEALAAKQGCLINESEFGDAMAGAGADIGTINIFVTNGVKIGQLEFIEEKNDEYIYRLHPCTPL